jgi:hypothetical protein
MLPRVSSFAVRILGQIQVAAQAVRRGQDQCGKMASRRGIGSPNPLLRADVAHEAIFLSLVMRFWTDKNPDRTIVSPRTPDTRTHLKVCVRVCPGRLSGVR